VSPSKPRTNPIGPADILDFWFSAGPDKWFRKAPAFDAEITRRFGALADDAARGALDHWAGSLDGTLALVLVLDQFRRNIHRGRPEAYVADAKALEIARAAVARGLDRELAVEHRKWLYLPFEHAEDLATQEEAVSLFAATGIADDLKWATDHRDIIARFGRFPHRNAILGRAPTAEEERFLAAGGFAG
jgi:uncharacterized protein (DUF924 family)